MTSYLLINNIWPELSEDDCVNIKFSLFPKTQYLGLSRRKLRISRDIPFNR